MFISIQAQSHGIMYGAGAHGAFQGCSYAYQESESVRDIKDYIAELRRERDNFKRQLRLAERKYRKLTNRFNGTLKETKDRLKEHLKSVVVTHITSHIRTPRDICEYKHACPPQNISSTTEASDKNNTTGSSEAFDTNIVHFEDNFIDLKQLPIKSQFLYKIFFVTNNITNPADFDFGHSI